MKWDIDILLNICIYKLHIRTYRGTTFCIFNGWISEKIMLRKPNNTWNMYIFVFFRLCTTTHKYTHTHRYFEKKKNSLNTCGVLVKAFLLIDIPWHTVKGELRMPECRIAFREALNIGGGGASGVPGDGNDHRKWWWWVKSKGIPIPPKMPKKFRFQVLPSDLFGGFYSWPFQGRKRNLYLGDQKVTWKKLEINF